MPACRENTEALRIVDPASVPAGYCDHAMKVGDSRGAYPADRAAALSGVPRSTVHYWARHEVLVPSVSPSRVKLWSYPDLMALRTIYWLRQHKVTSQGWDIPASTMPAVRRAIRLLHEVDLDLWTEDGGPRVAVDPAGEIFSCGARTRSRISTVHVHSTETSST